MTAKLGQFIQEEDAVVGQRHFAWQRHLPTPDEPHIGDRVGRGARRAGGDDCGAGAGVAGDAVDASGFEGFREGYCRQNGGQSARQPRRTALGLSSRSRW